MDSKPIDNKPNPHPQSTSQRPSYSNVPSGNTGHKKPHVFLLALLVIYIMVFLIGILSVYTWQHSKVDSLAKSKTELQTKLDQLNQANGKVASTIDSSKMQAVFLIGGTTYFGKLTSLDTQNYQLTEVYYLRSQSKDSSLVKLGCELHGPEDKMVVSREQVLFWENLKSDGQVAKAVSEYKKQNPNGQKCDPASQSSTQPSSIPQVQP